MFDLKIITNERLEDFDMKMVAAAARGKPASDLAVQLWARVLRELNMRGRVHLVDGADDEAAKACVRRLYLKNVQDEIDTEADVSITSRNVTDTHPRRLEEPRPAGAIRAIVSQ